MTSPDKKILNRFDELVELGRSVLATRRPPAPNHITSDFVDVETANRWMVSCQSLIERVLGEASPHSKRFSSLMVDYPKWPHAQQAFGVLLSAQDDVKSDALFDIRKLVEADLFDEFLDQAEHLLETGYYGPAAVVAGSVLEDGLLKICQRKKITLPTKPKLDSMNSELAKAGVYPKLTQKKVTAMADIRNSAAHGKWSDFTEADAQGMIADVRQFMERYFT